MLIRCMVVKKQTLMTGLELQTLLSSCFGGALFKLLNE